MSGSFADKDERLNQAAHITCAPRCGLIASCCQLFGHERKLLLQFGDLKNGGQRERAIKLSVGQPDKGEKTHCRAIYPRSSTSSSWRALVWLKRSMSVVRSF